MSRRPDQPLLSSALTPSTIKASTARISNHSSGPIGSYLLCPSTGVLSVGTRLGKGKGGPLTSPQMPTRTPLAHFAHAESKSRVSYPSIVQRRMTSEDMLISRMP
jgi:hypothetical protein